MAQPVTKDPKVPQDQPDPRVNPGHWGRLVTLGRPVSLAQSVQLETKDLQGPLGPQEILEDRDQQGPLVQQDNLDRLDRPVIGGLQEIRDLQDLLDKPDRLDFLDRRVLMVHLVLLAQLDPPDQEDPRDLQVTVVSPVHREDQVLLDLSAVMETLDSQVPRDPMDQLVLLGLLDLPDHLAQLVQPDNLETPGR